MQYLGVPLGFSGAPSCPQSVKHSIRNFREEIPWGRVTCRASPEGYGGAESLRVETTRRVWAVGPDAISPSAEPRQGRNHRCWVWGRRSTASGWHAVPTRYHSASLPLVLAASFHSIWHSRISVCRGRRITSDVVHFHRYQRTCAGSYHTLLLRGLSA